jgi:hypothetical protein
MLNFLLRSLAISHIITALMIAKLYNKSFDISSPFELVNSCYSAILDGTIAGHGLEFCLLGYYLCFTIFAYLIFKLNRNKVTKKKYINQQSFKFKKDKFQQEEKDESVDYQQNKSNSDIPPSSAKDSAQHSSKAKNNNAQELFVKFVLLNFYLKTRQNNAANHLLQANIMTLLLTSLKLDNVNKKPEIILEGMIIHSDLIKQLQTKSVLSNHNPDNIRDVISHLAILKLIQHNITNHSNHQKPDHQSNFALIINALFALSSRAEHHNILHLNQAPNQALNKVANSFISQIKEIVSTFSTTIIKIDNLLNKVVDLIYKADFFNSKAVVTKAVSNVAFHHHHTHHTNNNQNHSQNHNFHHEALPINNHQTSKSHSPTTIHENKKSETLSQAQAIRDEIENMLKSGDLKKINDKISKIFPDLPDIKENPVPKISVANPSGYQHLAIVIKHGPPPSQ